MMFLFLISRFDHNKLQEYTFDLSPRMVSHQLQNGLDNFPGYV